MTRPSDIDAIFAGYAEPAGTRLRALRQLILDTARVTPGVGPVEETLRWGQPSYLTSKSGSGSTIRIDAVKGSSDRYALYVHCQTDLLATFRAHYGQALSYEGERALVFDAGHPVDEGVVAHCISLALTYHLRRKALRRRGPAS